MRNWAADEVLGFDFETTGVDRFSDVPVSYALVTMVDGAVITVAAGLVNPGREIPAGATHVHGITTERVRAEGMPLRDAVSLVCEAVVTASQRGVPVVGMKLDYDLTILDTQARMLGGRGLFDRGWCGPVLDAVVLDRHVDRFRKGSRTLGSLCTHYGIDIGNAHDASADAIASIRVILEMARRFPELGDTSLGDLHQCQVDWHQEWARSFDEWRNKKGMAPMDPRDHFWPVAPAVVSAA
jgi:DNA polymerase-3 subunit epsilon